MEQGLLYFFPNVNCKDFSKIESLLENNNIFIAGNYGGFFDSNTSAVLSIAEHLRAVEIVKMKFGALLDRNLVSDITFLSKGCVIDKSKKEDAHGKRLAAAVMAFCICSGILIEWNMSLYEHAASKGNSSAHQDLVQLRIADNVNPTFYINIALNRSNSIPLNHLGEVRSKISVENFDKTQENFTKNLASWKANYVYALKTVLLLRESNSSKDAALKFLNWQSSVFVYNASASIYCLLAMSENRISGMFKQHKSGVKKNVCEGIFNATWDMCYVRQFMRLLNKSAFAERNPNDLQSWSFWSRDRALVSVIKTLIIKDDSSQHDYLLKLFREWWGCNGDDLFKDYQHHWTQSQNNQTLRANVVNERLSNIDREITDLENQIHNLFEQNRLA